MEGGLGAVGGVAGGFREFVVGFGGGLVGIYAGIWGLEEDDEEGHGGDCDCGDGDFVKENLYVFIHCWDFG